MVTSSGTPVQQVKSLSKKDLTKECRCKCACDCVTVTESVIAFHVSEVKGLTKKELIVND